MSYLFDATLREPHVVATRCDLYFPDVDEPVTVPVEGGQVTLDRTAAVRRSGTVTIPWSLQAGEDLGLDLRTLALGGYAVPFRGVRYGDGSRELVQLGRLRVESVTWQTLEGVASLELADRMAQVRDEPFITPYSPATGSEVSRNGTLTNGSPVVTGLSATSGLLVGMQVTGAGIQPATTIASIDSGSQVTLSRPAVTALTRTAAHINNPPLPPNQFDLVDGTDGLVVGMRVYSVAPNIWGTPSEPWPYPGTTITRIDSATRVVVADNSQPLDVIPEPPVDFSLTSNVQTLSFGGGKRIAAAAFDIVYYVFGDTIQYRKLYDPALITTDVYLSEGRAEALASLTVAAAADSYFDHDGSFVFAQPPNPEATPVWTVDAGATGVLVDADESLDRTGTVNGVLVEGQPAAAGAPVSALVTDDDAGSPTRWGGPFGKVARIERLSTVETVQQATAAAAEILARSLRLSRSLTLTAAPNPALEPGDVIRVRFPDGRDETHVIDVIQLDLGPAGEQQLAVSSVDALLPAPTRPGVHAARQVWLEAAR